MIWWPVFVYTIYKKCFYNFINLSILLYINYTDYTHSVSDYYLYLNYNDESSVCIIISYIVKYFNYFFFIQYMKWYKIHHYKYNNNLLYWLNKTLKKCEYFHIEYGNVWELCDN